MVLLVACNTGNKSLTEIQKNAVAEEAKVVIENVFDVLALADGEKRMEICENSDDFTFVLFDKVYSYMELKNFVANALQDAEKETFNTKTEKYIIIDQQCFTYIWYGEIDIYLKSGEAMSYENYFSTWTFRKAEGIWKMVSGHESIINN